MIIQAKRYIRENRPVFMGLGIAALAFCWWQDINPVDAVMYLVNDAYKTLMMIAPIWCLYILLTRDSPQEAKD